MVTNHPYHPIIYVRGFALGQKAIEEAVSDPYMGFNEGSTKSRRSWDGKVRRFYFESPLVRLMSDHKYEDVYINGDDLVTSNRPDLPAIPYRCVVIYRYYEEASKDNYDNESQSSKRWQGTPPIDHFAKKLGELIITLRDKICENPDNHVSKDTFRVYLVAHSMGGLICRALIQNTKLRSDDKKIDIQDARNAVHKLFTYGTPHNGVELLGLNVPGWFPFFDANNFNRANMSEYLGLPPGQKDVSLVKNFSSDHIFNLIGTNPHDYTEVLGFAALAAGDASDGLVRIENATTHGMREDDGKDVHSPCAFVHRSHSGHYGLVNSEEGYQNLTRFLFGKVRVDGFLKIDHISLPSDVEKARSEGKKVHASYQFEIEIGIRGGQWQMTRRKVLENSAICLTHEQLVPITDNRKTQQSLVVPHLFTVFLDPEKSVETGVNNNSENESNKPDYDLSKSVSFVFDLNILADYEVDGAPYLRNHYEGGFILHKNIIVTAFRHKTFPENDKEWKLHTIQYVFESDDKTNIHTVTEPKKLGNDMGIVFDIPIEKKGEPNLHGSLYIEARHWNSTLE